ncbi:MAG TPA: histidine--tRNA ligase, partial [Candidatus Limnocylindrales bacterium]|nr:histidine--tRNA ligase [Candidatus Limnocylindrales bacterium]
MDYRAPRGTRDILPDEAARWQFLESKFREFSTLYGFGEIRTPIFEQTELFVRSVGEESDIVFKEMYSFQDRSGRQLTLRPELTAAVVRAYLEHNLKEKPQPIKLYYNGPMFRYDRPQAGRYRQFHQFGLEIFGAARPAADAEIISFCYHFLKSLQIDDLAIELNSVGCPDCRPRFREALVPFLESLVSDLCDDCRRRYKTNPMRVLDCKEEKCQRMVESAPNMVQHLCDDCGHHFSTLKKLLHKLQIPFTLNTHLVRGLDYYTRTAFEIVTGDQGGARASLCGGGRYDNLVEHCGGPPTPGVGVAFGVERILLVMDRGKLLPDLNRPLFIAVAGSDLEDEAMVLAAELRQAGIAAEIELIGRSLKAQMKYAGRQGYQRVVIIGIGEIERETVTLRDMDSGEQMELPRRSLFDLLVDHSPVNKNKTRLRAAAEVSSLVDQETAQKTHYCGALNVADVSAKVKLAGWVGRRRDHGGLIFIDLRDRSGIVQLVFDQQSGGNVFAEAEKLRHEYVIAVEGVVIRRSPENVNPAVATGEIEVRICKIEILNSSRTPPFYIEDGINVDENLRLRYRYLDLRR